jgi:ParB-like chromosome segregation protein Spo0J
MKLSAIKPNPNNPRIIKDEAFKKLCKSIEEFPKMMALRPMVVDKDGVILGGNMRYKALQHLGMKEIPNEWVKRADDLSEDERRRFIIADNVSGGEWDVADLAANWDKQELEDWGVDSYEKKDLSKIQTKNIEPYKKTHILISIKPEQMIILQDIIETMKNKVTDIEIEIASN